MRRPWSRRHEHEARLHEVERRLADIAHALEGRAPASEVQRLNLAFDELAKRAPISEVGRLNLAFDELGQRASRQEVDARLASETARLDRAFEELTEVRVELADKAPLSEVERLDRAFRELAEVREILLLTLSERSVEIPWVLSSYRGERCVLEVGYAFAEERYLQALRSLDVPVLVGLDLAAGTRDDLSTTFRRVRADIRSHVFAPDSFDLVLCISTIEHVGRDNRRYGLGDGDGEERPDHRAISTMARWLRPGGRVLLSVPFGRYEDHGWLINYDAERLDALIAASGLELVADSYYEQRGGWVPCSREEIRRRGYRSLGVPHAGAVALIELRRTS
ncbi:MAG TPA: class I SAM-dependent methyltransferase [Nitriliruptorales bacterium]|nr:class I SAM-dependent methyltransferase [Nitriliruptorales bacterium]